MKTEAIKAFSILCKMLNLAEVWGYRPEGTHYSGDADRHGTTTLPTEICTTAPS